MQNITVKVCYRGKTLIVGKGVTPIDEIFKELVKRFPEAEQIKSSLVVEYENGAQDLNSAYKLAQKQNKRFIKVKFHSGLQYQQSFVSDKLNDSTVVLVVDQAEEKTISELTQKLEDTNSQIKAHLEEKLEIFEPLENKSEGQVNPIVTEAFFKKDIPESEQTLLIEPLKKSQEKTESKDQVQILPNPNLKNQETELQVQSESKFENPIDYSLLNNSFKNEEKQEEEVKALNREARRKNFERLFGLQVESAPQKSQPLNSEGMAILEILRKEFDSKIQTLQIQYDDLKLKYNDLSSKYDSLLMEVGKNRAQKKEEKKMDPQKVGYEKIPEKDPSQKYDSSQQIEYFAEINEFDTLEEVHVGEMVQSRFRFKNIGHKKWPENLYAFEQHSQDHVPIKSLEPNESAIVLLHTQKASKVGEKINKIYQLKYFDEKNNVKKFGRQFGISIRVIGPIVHPKPFKPLKPQPAKSKPSDPQLDFREYVLNFLQRNKLTKKSLYDVITYLLDFNVTAENYKNYEVETLNEFIRSYCA